MVPMITKIKALLPCPTRVLRSVSSPDRPNRRCFRSFSLLPAIELGTDVSSLDPDISSPLVGPDEEILVILRKKVLGLTL